jgi:hypothetical protein
MKRSAAHRRDKGVGGASSLATGGMECTPLQFEIAMNR